MSDELGKYWMLHELRRRSKLFAAILAVRAARALVFRAGAAVYLEGWIDLGVLLARMHLHCGQYHRAFRICQEILALFDGRPFAKESDALRIVAATVEHNRPLALSLYKLAIAKSAGRFRFDELLPAWVVAELAAESLAEHGDGEERDYADA